MTKRWGIDGQRLGYPGAACDEHRLPLPPVSAFGQKRTLNS